MAQTEFHLPHALRDLVRRSGRWSPPDWIFLPASMLVMAGLIVLGLSTRPGAVDAVISDTEFVMQGEALAQLIPGPGTRFELTIGPAGEPLARLSATASFDAAGLLSAGVGAALPTEWEENAIGRIVRLEVEAQAASDSRIDQIRVGYFTVGYGDSERTLKPVGQSWSTVGICYQVAPTAQANGVEWLGIWPGDAGNGEAVLVRSIRLTLEPPGDAMAQCEARLSSA
ncbi:hypothetical protein [Oceanicaulis sp.]|jgi:hypothetical protein|uniref:hypothetical protein n=1 Tax=Oceanicaulis sp. TaxID=1924941 RepID=UPI000D3141C9